MSVVVLLQHACCEGHHTHTNTPAGQTRKRVVLLIGLIGLLLLLLLLCHGAVCVGVAVAVVLVGVKELLSWQAATTQQPRSNTSQNPEPRQRAKWCANRCNARLIRVQPDQLLVSHPHQPVGSRILLLLLPSSSHPSSHDPTAD
jgi:hypothetical protein